jgi:small-conductance mechanosensitive channel
MHTQSGDPSNTVASSTPPASGWSLADRLFDLPRTRLAWWSVALAFCFFVFLTLFASLVGAGHRGGSDLWLLVSISATGASALGGGLAALIAVIRYRERSFVLIGPLLLGVLVAAFLALELAFPH